MYGVAALSAIPKKEKCKPRHGITHVTGVHLDVRFHDFRRRPLEVHSTCGIRRLFVLINVNSDFDAIVFLRMDLEFFHDFTTHVNYT